MSTRGTVVGTTEGFAGLFGAHFRSTVRLAALMGADDPENVAQEAFARLHVRWSKVDDDEGALRYVRTIVCNLARSRHRHLAVVRRTAPRLVTLPAPSADEDVVAADESRRVLALVQGLPRRQHEVLVLRYWSGLSEAQIAATLGISPGSVKTHASRGLAAVQRGMEDS